MKRAALLILLFVLFVGGGCRNEHGTPTTPPISSQTSTGQTPEEASPVHFDEIAAAWGIDSTYQDGSEKGFVAILESLGGGVGVLDYDVDGCPDLYFPAGGDFHDDKTTFGRPSKLFRQLTGNPTPAYRDVSNSCHGVVAPHYSHGCAVTDMDNDGFDDILVTGYGGVQFFHNCGDGTFYEVSQPGGLTDPSWSSSAAWGDLNGDGANDLYLTHYVDWSPENDPPCFFGDGSIREICPPRRFSGLSDIIYLSDGHGGFTAPGETFGDVSHGKGLGVAMADVDLDGDLDVYVTNDNVKNSLLINSENAKLVESGTSSGTAYGDTGREDGSMGIDIGDFNGDGLPDIWVTNYENETFALYRSHDGSFFQHVSRSAGISAAGGLSVGWGTVFADLDLDGDEDLFAGNGHVIRHPTNSPLQQAPLVLLNESSQRFRDIAHQAGTYTATPHMSRGVVAGDLDDDGDLDLVVSHINQPAAVLQNNSPRVGNWLKLKLVGTQSARWSEGAWLELETSTGRKQIRLKKGGTSYASTSAREIHFGCGEGVSVKKLTVHWPSGIVQEFTGLSTGESVVLVEGQDALVKLP
ncbi:MAG: CRTAC1 family protein [Planctomycetaceae bacterium]